MRDPYQLPDDVVHALMRLDLSKEFHVYVDFLRAELAELSAIIRTERDEIRLRWLQGEVATIAAIIEHTDTVRAQRDAREKRTIERLGAPPGNVY